YVLRRLLRRAIKHGKQLGINEPFLYLLVDTVANTMGDFYPYLFETSTLVKKIIKIEEEKFLETLNLGEKILEDIIHSNDSKIISGEQAFTLYDTYGFPLELTEELAEHEGFSVDKVGFKEEMDKQKDRARNARKNTISMKSQNEEFINFKEKDQFTGYNSLEEKTEVLRSFEEGVVLAKTPFYAESGGQVADKGIIQFGKSEFEVLDVQKLPNGQFMHFIENNSLKQGDKVVAIVDEETRKSTMFNHSATHILFAALREIVGPHVSQHGSQVSSETLRFDFNNFDNLSDDTLLQVEKRVNEIIQKNQKVEISEMTIDEAKALGAIAEFGEKYGDLVRVINMSYTVDLCGGTHVSNTGVIEKFAIASIESKGSGIYRIVGHANQAIENIRNQFVGFHKEMDKLLLKAEKIVEDAKLKDIDLTFDFEINNEILGSYQDIINKRLEFSDLQEKVRDFEKQYKELLREKTFENIEEFIKKAKDGKIVMKVENIDKDSLKPLADRLLEKLGKGFVFIANITDDKVTFIAKSNCEIHAGNMAKEAALITGGNGGGRPDMAQAGGKDISKVDEALNRIKELVL
ncbi:MAG: alanine--tRNA ligase, partial [Firmicutes bacterium]|nr:alanine--tRNA ligase [Bacillota bacterium]